MVMEMQIVNTLETGVLVNAEQFWISDHLRDKQNKMFMFVRYCNMAVYTFQPSLHGRALTDIKFLFTQNTENGD